MLLWWLCGVLLFWSVARTEEDAMTRIAIVAAVTAMLMALTSAANAAWYAKFDGVDGSSKAEDHEGWIEVFSVQFPNASDPAAKHLGRPSISFYGATYDDEAKALPKLHEYAVKGKVFKNVILSLIGGEGGTAQSQFKFTEVLISSYQTSGAGNVQLVLTYRSWEPVGPDAPGPTIVPLSLTGDGGASDGGAQARSR
jgi:type VI protein secretion system component Hcp